MNAMLDRLEDSLERQNRFVADVSHELHSPLASSRAELEVARAHPDATDWQVVTEELLADNSRMERIVTDLLYLARCDNASAGPTDHGPVDLDDIVRNEVRRLLARTDVRVSTAEVQTVDLLGRADDLARAVGNLLDNAERYARAEITVTLARTGDTARLTVSDDGPGIQPGDRARVFERFTRLDESRSRATGGSGLGLAITTEIVAGHGGSIWVEEVSGGARFVIELPTA